MLSFIVVMRVAYCGWKRRCAGFFFFYCLCIQCICIVVGYWIENPINQSYPPYFIASPNPGPELPQPYVVVLLCSMV